MWRSLSLANKCLLLFGGAVVLIVLTALAAPWFRMNALVDEGQLEQSRQLVDAWERLDTAPTPLAARYPSGELVEHAGIRAMRLSLEQADGLAKTDPFLARALRRFQGDPDAGDYQLAKWSGITREYRYVRAIRSPASPQDLQGMILLQRSPLQAARLLAINTAYLLSSGIVVLGLAVLVFYIITHWIVLSPVRTLRETAERIREGDLATRSD